jgi:hypothetical protein
MNQGCALAIFLGTFVAASGSFGADWKPIKGNYAVTAKNYNDPADDEARDSHLRIQLTGTAARDLFSAMKVPVVKDECTGAVQKKIGNMVCWQYNKPKRYECDFAIDITAQKISVGSDC